MFSPMAFSGVLGSPKDVLKEVGTNLFKQTTGGFWIPGRGAEGKPSDASM